ncbi:unnamed protein product [Arabidopsis thaliana]|uniref:(thale cress) hypothetical protein n=1 Tax=Arabidopsis thaliana TaxID=3702 RepID=A0A7G2FC72_ARATH|nr:unnamed protein product [Arabidopsis thaliana]
MSSSYRKNARTRLKNGCVRHSKSMSQRRQAVRTTKPHRRRWSPGRFGT